jgi:hypothetical protein
VAVVAAAKAQEPAAPTTVIQDDAVFLHSSDDEIRTAVAHVRGLGIERVRITAGWSVIAPSPQARGVPDSDLSDPAAYPPENWRNLDRAVRLVSQGGLAPMIDIAFWAPRWATHDDASAETRLRTEVDPQQYAHFAHAVAERYGDDVDIFTIWNEPNHPGFLVPQWVREAGRFVPRSPHIYRAMVQAAYPAVKAAAPDSRVLIGATSSMGSDEPGRGGVPPLRFLRELACVDDHLLPIAGGRCADFSPIPGDGWSHHPYSLRTTPDRAPRDPDVAPVARTPRLASLLRRLVAMGRIAAPAADIYMTEYGYETNPPDPRARFSLADQPRLLAWAESIATRTPQVVMWPQFLLRDRPGGPAGPRLRPFGDWQTGLMDAAGNPKPAFESFRTPVFARCVHDGRRRMVEVWGRVRGDALRTSATVEARPSGTRGDDGWSRRLSSDRPRISSPRAVSATAPAPGAAVRRYLPWRIATQLRLRWMSSTSAGLTTDAIDTPPCPPRPR